MKVPRWKIEEYKLQKRWNYLKSDEARNTMTCAELEAGIAEVIGDHQGALDKMLVAAIKS